MKKIRPKMNKKEHEVFSIAKKLCDKDPILGKQSSACRRNWCEGFMNGYLYYLHKQPKVRWYEFWKKF